MTRLVCSHRFLHRREHPKIEVVDFGAPRYQKFLKIFKTFVSNFKVKNSKSKFKIAIGGRSASPRSVHSASLRSVGGRSLRSLCGRPLAGRKGDFKFRFRILTLKFAQKF